MIRRLAESSRLVYVGLFVALTSMILLLTGDTVQAASGYGSGRNGAERAAWPDPCGQFTSHPCATWWPSLPGSGYFDMAGTSPSNPVEMEWNATTLDINIRGSWNNQKYSRAIQIYSLFSFNGAGRRVEVTNPAGHRDAIGNYFFNRGYYGGGSSWQWINSSDHLALRVDMNGVATPGGGAELVTLGAQSCLARMTAGNIIKTYSGNAVNCGTDNIRLWVRRKAQPAGWNIQGESYVYSRTDNRHYANYNNSNASYAHAHASEAPAVYPGQTAEFTADLRNVVLPGYRHVNSSIQAVVDMAYFKSYADVANCARQDWISNCGGTATEKDTKTRIVYGAGVLDSAAYRGRSICKSVRSNIIQAPNSLTGWSAAGSGEDCMRLKVPEGPSRLGQYLCTKTSWFVAASNSASWNSSTPACVYVASDFNLVPGVGSSNGSTTVGQIEQGGATSVTSTIHNLGGPRGSSGNSDASVYTFAFTGSNAANMSNANVESMMKSVFDKNKGDLYYTDANFGGTSDTCVWLRAQAQFTGRVGDCVAGAATQRPFDSTEDIDNSPIDTARYDVGDIVCRVAVVNRYNWDTNKSTAMYRVSYPRCYRIAKKPMVQIWGGDVRVGSSNVGDATVRYRSGIYTGGSRNLIIGGEVRSLGSWGEYGLYAPSVRTSLGSNIQSASAGALSGVGAGAYSGVMNGSALNKLSFANTGSIYGQWGTIGAHSVVKAQYFAPYSSHSGSRLSLDGLASGSYKLTGAGGRISMSGTVGDGKSIIVDGGDKTVVIDGDISYQPGNYTTPGAIPQLVIFARNIIIKDNVRNVDAWLIASGTTSGVGGVVSTCETDSTIDTSVTRSDYTAELRSDVCNNPLQINGPVVARVLQLRRTFGAEKIGGSENGYTTPAEVINMRADAYIWALARANASGAIDTDITTELPPRY